MRIIGVAALCVVLGGCASATRGTTESINIITTPAGATASVLDTYENVATQCITPCSMTVKRAASIAVTVSKPGFMPNGVSLKNETTGGGAAAMAGNVLFGGLVGVAVDSYNGAGFDHTPNPVVLTLEPEPIPPAPGKPKPKMKPAPVAQAGT